MRLNCLKTYWGMFFNRNLLIKQQSESSGRFFSRDLVILGTVYHICTLKSFSILDYRNNLCHPKFQLVLSATEYGTCRAWTKQRYHINTLSSQANSTLGKHWGGLRHISIRKWQRINRQKTKTAKNSTARSQ